MLINEDCSTLAQAGTIETEALAHDILQVIIHFSHSPYVDISFWKAQAHQALKDWKTEE